MKTIKTISAEIETLKTQLVNAPNIQAKGEIEEQIQELEWDIDEIIEAEEEQRDHDEMTGNTPQDRYLEQNHDAIVQSERYEQFRREY